MKQYLPEGLIASLAGGQAVLLAAANQPPSTIVTLAGLTVTLGGGLVWTIKHILGKTIPQLAQQHAADVVRLCDSFDKRGQEDREANRANHKEIVGALGKVAGAVEKLQDAASESRDGIRQLLQETPHALRIYQSDDGAPPAGPSAGPGGRGA